MARSYKKRVPFSNSKDNKHTIKPVDPKPLFDNGEYGNEVDHTDDAPLGVVFFSEEERAMLAGALYRLARRYPMNAPFIKFQEAQYMYDGALQLMALKPIELWNLRQTLILLERQNKPGGTWSTLYDPSDYVIVKNPGSTLANTINAGANIRALYAIQAGGDMAIVGVQTGGTGRVSLLAMQSVTNTDTILLLDRPVSNGDYLRVKVNGLERTAINRYGQLTALFYNSNLPTANSDTVGSFIYLQNSAVPGTYPDGVYIGTFIPGTPPVYYWTQFKGAQGEPGEGLPGETGHGIAFASPPSVAVKTNVAPSLSVNNTNPAVTVVQANLPVAQKTVWLDPILIPYGNPIALDTSLNGDGDQVAQLYMPAGQPGGGEGGGVSKKTSPPVAGTIETYEDSIQANGTLVPFQLVSGDIITVPEQPRGLWSFYSTVGVKDYVTDENGMTVGAFDDVGKLVIETLSPSDNVWQEQDYTPGVTIEEDGSYARWKQKEVIPSIRSGELQLKYEVYRPIVLRYDQLRNALMGINPIRYYRCNELSGSGVDGTVLTDEFGNQMTISGTGYALNQAGAYSGDNHRAIHWTGAHAKETASGIISGDHSYSIVCVAKQSGRAIFAALSPNTDSGGTKMQSVGYYAGQVGFFGRGSPSGEILTGALPDTNFHLFHFTYDASTHERKVWMDDDLIADGAYTWIGGDSSLFFRIGTDIFAGSDWTGCEIALYNFKIQSDDVAYNYAEYQKSLSGA